MKLQHFLDIFIFIISITLFVLFSRLYLIIPFVLLALLLRIIIAYKNKRGKLQHYSLILIFILMLLTLLFNNYLFTIFTTIVTAIVFLTFILNNIIKNKSSTKSQKLLKAFGLLGLFFLILGYIILAYNSINPDTLTRESERIFPGKVVADKSVKKNEDGSIYYKNLTYPSKYQNNKMDIYTPKKAKGTIFYVHGGGFAFDDKSEREKFLFRYVKSGYNVININYQLAPNARYPETIEQVNDALTFIREHTKQYNINMNKIVFAGDSAGGQLTGQLINLMNNKEYAKQVGITPANHSSNFQPKGYIAIGPLIDSPKIANTDFFLTDWLFDTLGRSYFDTTDVLHSEKAKQASVSDHVTKDFPPTFISDGNFGTFTKDNKKFEKKLHKLNVPVNSQFYDRSKGKLLHVYELDLNNKYAQKIHQKHLDFLDNLFKK